MKNLDILNWKPILHPSKGTHIWLKKDTLQIPSPLLLRASDGRVVFVIPHFNRILVGTTESEIKGDFFDLEADSKDIEYIFNILNDFFPNTSFGQEDILSSFCGVRPLIYQEGTSMSNVSRDFHLLQPLEDLYVIVGGKYTSFRLMAQAVNKCLTNKHAYCYNPVASLTPLTQHCCLPPFKDFTLSWELIENILNKELVRTFDDLLIRRLGINNRNFFCHQKSFEEFFMTILPQLKDRIMVDEETIRNWN